MATFTRPGEPAGPIDLWIDQMSLPRLLALRAEAIPDAPYLAADPGRAAAWHRRLPPGPRVGIVWAGNPRHGNDRRRSIPLDRLDPVFAALAEAGVAAVSLQAGPGSPEITARHGITDRATALTDFAETAAIVANLDLVVAVDTSVAHLAGALGVPVWVLLPHAPDWRWMLGRTDSAWYRTMRLFRQAAPGDWSGPVAAVAAGLAARHRCRARYGRLVSA